MQIRIAAMQNNPVDNHNSATKSPQSGPTILRSITQANRSLDMAKVNGKYLNDIAGDLSEDMQLEYLAVKESYNQHKAVQKAFEAKLAKYLEVPEGKVLNCSYRYGQLSISVEDSKA